MESIIAVSTFGRTVIGARCGGDGGAGMSGCVFAILTVGVGLLGAAGTRLIRAVSFFGSAVAGEVTVGIRNGTAMGLTTGGGRDGGEKEVGGGTLFFGGGGNEGSGGESRSGIAALADGATSGGGRNGLDGGGGGGGVSGVADGSAGGGRKIVGAGRGGFGATASGLAGKPGAGGRAGSLMRTVSRASPPAPGVLAG